MFARIKSFDAVLSTAGRTPLPRTMGAWNLILLGVGAVIGTGIFVLTSEAAQKAGPGMMVSFAIAGLVCAAAALCYAECAAMVPVAGSAYTYCYMSLGELPAWLVAWALVLEYGLAGAAVSVGWSGYFVGQLHGWLGIDLPHALIAGPYAGGIVNLPAMAIGIAITGLLILGTRESVRFNAILVAIKVTALAAFLLLVLPVMRLANFEPFAPVGWSGQDGTGILGAAGSLFFAYIGFDGVSSAAEETKHPQRNLPLGLIGALAICTAFYMLVSAGAIGSPLGAQPVHDAAGRWLAPGSGAFADRCAALTAGGATEPLACSREALAHILRELGYPNVGNLIGLAAFLALPSVILVMIYGQTRMLFAMARDGLIPSRLSVIHARWKTPYLITAITGGGIVLASAFLPVGKLVDIANTGTLTAFTLVAVATLIMRRTHPAQPRPFRVPVVWLVAPATIIGCVGLFWNLPLAAKLALPAWGVIGAIVYFSFGHRHSELAGDNQ